MSLTTPGPAGVCIPLVQMEFFSSPEVAGEEKNSPNTKRTRPRVRPPECPFPDPQDTQLAWLPHPACNDEEFTDSEIVAFHEDAIHHALHSLADGRTSEVMRRRVIEWVAVPMVHKRKLTDLLSFQAMCYAAGCNDPEFLQEYILRRFAPERLADLGLPR
jgi:hypothetical protein